MMLFHLSVINSPWLCPESWRWGRTRPASSRSDESQRARGSWPRLRAPTGLHALGTVYHGTMGNPPGWHRRLTLWLLHCPLRWNKSIIFSFSFPRCWVFIYFDTVCLERKRKCLCYHLQRSWSPGPLGTGGSALKACGMGAGWRGVPCNGLRGHCNALKL